MSNNNENKKAFYYLLNAEIYTFSRVPFLLLVGL